VAWLGPSVERTARAELSAAVAPPQGRFAWRYPHTPHELQTLWRPGQPNDITRGAVMMLEHDHGLAVDGFAGKEVWSALIADVAAGPALRLRRLSGRHGERISVHDDRRRAD